MQEQIGNVYFPIECYLKHIGSKYITQGKYYAKCLKTISGIDKIYCIKNRLYKVIDMNENMFVLLCEDENRLVIKMEDKDFEYVIMGG